jgi:hypothetical protein
MDLTPATNRKKGSSQLYAAHTEVSKSEKILKAKGSTADSAPKLTF